MTSERRGTKARDTMGYDRGFKLWLPHYFAFSLKMLEKLPKNVDWSKLPRGKGGSK